MAQRLRQFPRRGGGSTLRTFADRKIEACMRNVLGLGVIVLGFILVAAGWDSFDSLASRFSRLFHGSAPDRTLWYLIGGVVVVAVGASMVWGRRSQKA